jgi:hypothetical protein
MIHIVFFYVTFVCVIKMEIIKIITLFSNVHCIIAPVESVYVFWTDMSPILFLIAPFVLVNVSSLLLPSGRIFCYIKIVNGSLLAYFSSHCL